MRMKTKERTTSSERESKPAWLLAAIESIKPELEKVKSLRTHRSCNVLESSLVFDTIKSKLPPRAWAPLCDTGLFGVAKREADMFVSIAGKIAKRLSQENIDCLPASLTALYWLSLLDQPTLEQYIKMEIVHRTMTAEEAKALARDQPGAAHAKPNIDRRVRKFSQF